MPFDVSRVKAFCFDVDGTLSDTDDKWVAGIERRLSVLRFLLPARDARAAARWLVMATETPMNAIYHRLDACSLDDNFARLYERLILRRRQAPKTFWLMQQADSLLASLSVRFPLSVVSARDESTTLNFIDQFQLGQFFQSVATSQTCEHTKPYPHPILWAAERMGIAPANCVMVGDTTVDVVAGRAAGAQTIGVLCGFGTEKELRRAGADLIVQNLGEIQNLFK
ncbi:MAG: HAD family hydrolase [Anaerolineaceae bacterium]|nr:HAD family hydrolase [Anaerolineaceae bacterium]